MAKNQSNTDDLLTKLEALASRLEKTNSNLGEKVGEIIKAQASSRATESELKQQLETTELELTKLKEKVSTLDTTIATAGENASKLKETIETNQETTTTKITDLTKQITQTVEKQAAMEKEFQELYEGFLQHTKELKRESTIYMALFGLIVVYIIYNTLSLGEQISNLNSRLDSINQQITESKSQENKTDPETKPTANNKQKPDKK